jgi:gliding motility-associatede transport system auxiliary component
MAGAVKTKSAALISIVVVILIVIMVNLLSLNIFGRLDMTENKMYSISETSKKIIGNLDDRLTVKIFFTDDLPAPHNSDQRYLNDLLDDFKAFSNGNLHFEFLDPLKEENQQEAASYRLQPVRFDVRGSTKAESILGYKSVVMLYGGKQEIMPFIMNMQNFEYDFIHKIKKLISPSLPKLGFTSGHSELGLTTELTGAQQLLGEDFEVLPLVTSDLESIPDEIEALFIVAPDQPFTEHEIYLIDQYIMRGGKVGFFLSSFVIDQNAGSITPVNTGLDPLLAHYGIAVNKDYVVDKSCYRYTNFRRVEGGVIPENIEVPWFINILNFNKEHMTVKLQKGMSLIGASSLDTAVALAPGLIREVLFSSSEKSGSVSGNMQIGLQTVSDSSYNDSYLPLAAVISGRFTSYFTNRPVPQPAQTDSMAINTMIEPITDGIDSRIIVIGNGNFFDDGAARDRSRRFQQNFVFFRNIVDWMAQDEDLITIRSKTNLYNPFTKVISDKSKTTVKLLNVFAIPFMVILAGLVRWQMKRTSKRRSRM